MKLKMQTISLRFLYKFRSKHNSQSTKRRFKVLLLKLFVLNLLSGGRRRTQRGNQASVQLVSELKHIENLMLNERFAHRRNNVVGPTSSQTRTSLFRVRCTLAPSPLHKNTWKAVRPDHARAGIWCVSVSRGSSDGFGSYFNSS